MPVIDPSSRKPIAHFLFAARNKELIDGNSYARLTMLLHELTSEQAKPVPVHTVERATVAVATKSAAPAAATRGPLVDVKPRPPFEQPQTVPPLATVAPRPERRVATARRKVAEKRPNHDVLALMSKGWGHLVGDVLANVLLYVGVLLATVAIFSFFAFGHFGNVVTNPDMRPLVFLAVPLAFAGMARLLRQQVAVQMSADAIGVIGALTLPIMLSGLFRDGSAIIPDASGSARWVLYAIVGVVSGAVYWRMSLGRPIYGYLVAPVLWASVGALGLYLRSGMSSYQLYLVLAAMAVAVIVVAKGATGPLAVPTARMAAVGFPGVLLVSLVFAFQNGDDPLGPSPAIAAAVTGAMLISLSTVDSLWSDVRLKARASIQSGMRSAGYLSLGLATALTVSWLASPTWVGPVLVAYSLVVWLVDERLGGAGDWVGTGARLGAILGAGVAMLYVGPAISVLLALVFVSAVWLLHGQAREPIRRFVGESADDNTITLAGQWAPLALGVVGLARVDPPAGGWLMLGLALVMVASRWLPRRAANLGAWARYPGLAMTIATFAYLAWYEQGGLDRSVGALLLFGVAIVASGSVVPWFVRGWIVLISAIAAVGLAAPVAVQFEVLAIASLVTGLVCVASTQPRSLLRDALANSTFGHVAYVFAGALALTTVSWKLGVVVGAVLIVANLAEAVLAENGNLRWVRIAVRIVPASEEQLFLALPATLASASFLLTVGIVWENIDASAALAAMVAGWALLMAVLSASGRIYGPFARVAVYGFGLAAIAAGSGTGYGWGATLIAAVAVSTLYVNGRRSVDLYTSIVGFGIALTQLVARSNDPELVLVTISVYGALLLLGVSGTALLQGDRALTAPRRPFVELGTLILGMGSGLMVGVAVLDVDLERISVLSAGSTLLGATAAFAFAGWVYRWKWAGAIVATLVPIGYFLIAWSFTDQLLHPAVMMPLIVGLVLAAAVVPERGVMDPLESPSGAMMISALGTTSVMAVAAIDSPYANTTLLVTAAVVVVARYLWQTQELRYVAAGLLLVAGGFTNIETSLAATTLVLAFSAWWEHRALDSEALALRWVTTALFLASFLLLAEVLDAPIERMAAAAFFLGAVAAGLSSVYETILADRAARRWWPQLAVAGRVGMLGGVVGFAYVDPAAGLYALSLWSGIETAIVTWYAVRRPHALLRWMSAALFVATSTLSSMAFDVPIPVVAPIAFVVGLALTIVSVSVSDRQSAFAPWWPQMAVVGRIGLYVGVVGFGYTDVGAGLYALAGWAGIEAGVSARYAAARDSELLAWLATTLAVAAGLVLETAANAPISVAAVMWWFIGAAGLVAWTTLASRRMATIWNPSLGTYAHLAIVMSSAVLIAEMGDAGIARWITALSLLVFAAAWLVAARSGRYPILAIGAGVAGVASWCVATGSTTDVAANFVRWMPAFLLAATIWRLLAHRTSEVRRLWERAAAAAAISSFLVVLAAAAVPSDRSAWIRSAMVLALGAVAIYDLPTLRGLRVTGSDIARLLLVLSSWLMIGWYRPGDTASVVVLFSVTMVGVVVAILSASRSGLGSHPDTWMWIGLHAGSAAAALAIFGWPSSVAVLVLMLIAASVTAHGVLSGSRRLAMFGVEGFLAIGALLVFQGEDVSLLVGSFFAAVAIVTATETERLIATARNQQTPPWVRTVEWLGLLIVPAVAITSGIQDMEHLPLLGIYGAAVGLWGIVTQVRRRVFAGALAILAAVIIALVTPIANGISVGMATAGGVGMTFAAGVLVIMLAILIERYHDRLGIQLNRLTDAMADWD